MPGSKPSPLASSFHEAGSARDAPGASRTDTPLAQVAAEIDSGGCAEAAALDQLTVTRPAALAAAPAGWRREVLAPVANQPVLLEALVAVATQAFAGARRALVRGVSPLSEPLCRALGDAGMAVEIDVEGYPVASPQLFDVPICRDPAAEAFDLIVSDRARQGDARTVSPATPAVLAAYRRALLAHRRALATRLDAVVAADRHVVFVARKSYFNQLRTSRALRRHGFRTAAVVLNIAAKAHLEDSFDEVIATDLGSLLGWVASTRRALLHTQAWLFGHQLPVLLDAYLPAGSRQVVELMDVNSFLFPGDELAARLPHMQKTWGPDVAERQREQVACERYLVEQADGVIFPGSVTGHMEALGVPATRRDRCLEFLCYPLAEFSTSAETPPRPAPRSARELRLVFAGGVTPAGEHYPPELFADAQFVDTAALLLGQGLRLDVYNNPLIGPEETYPIRYRAHLELERRYPSYRFRHGAMPWQMRDVLRGYDYGLIVYDYRGLLFGAQHFRQLVPTKLFMYLEAGLPVLVSARAAAAARIVEHYGIGRVVSEAELRDLAPVLESLDYAKLQRNVAAARAALAMDKEIERLIAFYDRVR